MSNGANTGRSHPMRLTYEVETHGEAIERELPFVIGVIGEFSGPLAQPGVDLDQRSFLDVTDEHLAGQEANGSARGLAALHAVIAGNPRAQLRALHMTRSELTTSLGRAAGMDEMLLFRRVYHQEYGTLDGIPYGALLVDFEFDHGAADVAALERLAEIGSQACCLVVTSAAPSIFGIDGWDQLQGLEQRKSMFCSAVYREWHALKDRDVARFLGLSVPVRTGVSRRNSPPAAYALGALMLRNHLESGRPSELGSMSVPAPCGHEVAVGAIELLGAVPVGSAGAGEACGIGALRSVQRARRYHDEARTQVAQASRNLAHVMTMALFARCLAIICRVHIGGFMTNSEYERLLNRWMARFVDQNAGDAEGCGVGALFSTATVRVSDVPGEPGAMQFELEAQPLIPGMAVPGTSRICSRIPGMG